MLCIDNRQSSLFALFDAPPPAAPVAAALPPISRDQQLAEGHALDGLMVGDFTNITACEIGKRAAEIALAGDHTLALTGDYEARDAVAAATEASRDRLNLPFPIIWRGQPEEADMAVQQSPISEVDRRLPPPSDGSSEIEQRVRQARARLDEGLTEASLDEPAQRLLDDAARAMGLDSERVARVEGVALTIAALAGSPSIKRIHVAEALAYQQRPPQPAPPAPPPNPPTTDNSSPARKPWRADWEVIETDPKRLEFSKGDIANSYSAQSLCDKGEVRNPFRFRGGDWVKTGGLYHGDRVEAECYRIVPVEAFDGPHAPYSEHPWDAKRGDKTLGGYHGMSATHGKRQVALQGPPVVFVNGQPEQGGLL